MKKYLFFLLFVFSKGWAGIPVIDPTSIAQLKMQYDQLVQQVQTLKDQVAQADRIYKDTVSEGKRLYDGFRSFGVDDFLRDPTLSGYIKKAEDLYSKTDGIDINKKREQYQLKSDNKLLQKRYDDLIAQLGNMENSYMAMQEYDKHLKDLSEKMASAKTPKEKEDFQNSLQLESLKMNNEVARMEMGLRASEQNMKLIQAQLRLEQNKALGFNK